MSDSTVYFAGGGHNRAERGEYQFWAMDTDTWLGPIIMRSKPGEPPWWRVDYLATKGPTYSKYMGCGGRVTGFRLATGCEIFSWMYHHPGDAKYARVD